MSKHIHEWRTTGYTMPEYACECGVSEHDATKERIHALEAGNAELRLVRDAAHEEIIAGREHLNIAGQEIDALKAENARMRAVVEATAKWAYGLDHDAFGATVRGGMYSMSCPICHRRLTGPEYSSNSGDYGHTADCPVTIARAILASDKQEMAQ